MPSSIPSSIAERYAQFAGPRRPQVGIVKPTYIAEGPADLQAIRALVDGMGNVRDPARRQAIQTAINDFNNAVSKAQQPFVNALMNFDAFGAQLREMPRPVRLADFFRSLQVGAAAREALRGSPVEDSALLTLEV